MAFISRETYLRQQKERQEREEYYRNQGPRVSYFGLKDDGDEAIVRFPYSDPSEFDIFTTHQTQIDGRFRRVSCLREDFTDAIDKCPMCAAGIPIQQRFYVKLIEYTRDENNEVVATPKVWERSLSYVQMISDLIEEYGDIREYVFKIKRSGKKGSLQTTYSILPANQKIYNNETYPADFSAFENYKVLGHALMDKDKDGMLELLGATKEEEPVEEKPQTTYQQAQPRKVVY